MLIKTLGIVFRSAKFGETSLMVDVFTEEKGVQTMVINGVRSAHAKIPASLLQPMTQLDLIMYYRDDREVCRIRELKNHFVYTSLPFDVIKGSIGIFIIEVTRNAIKEKTSNPDLYHFISQYLSRVDAMQVQELSLAPIHYMIQLSYLLGFGPDMIVSNQAIWLDLKEGWTTTVAPLHSESLSPHLTQLFLTISQTNLSDLHQISSNKEDRKVLLQKMLHFFSYHLDYFTTIRSLDILQTVL